MEVKKISFPPSVQSDLFNYLKPEQQKVLRPYLRLFKPQYQEELCISLLDYLEGHGLDPLSQPVLRILQTHIVQTCGLHPLTLFRNQGLEKNTLNIHQPKSIGTIIKQFFKLT